MNTLATFEIYPDRAVVCASRYGAEPCAPPVATMARRVALEEPDLHEILGARPIARDGRLWLARSGCPFVSCPAHRPGQLYLATTIEDPGALQRFLDPLGLLGWKLDEAALAAYGFAV